MSYSCIQNICFYVLKIVLFFFYHQSLEEKLSSYAPTMEQLRESCDQLRDNGQASLADDITRLSGLHQALTDQVAAQLDTCKAAVGQRKAFGQLIETQERLVTECEFSLDGAGGQPVEERIQVYKV